MKNSRAKAKTAKRIPAPPGPDASYDEIIAYHSKYTLDELEKAGYATEPPPGELEDLETSATYELLREYGVRLKLSRKEAEQLARLAASKQITAERLVERWTKERLRQEAGKGTERS